MTLENEKLLDDIGWQILQALQENARIPFAELGRLVSLSSPAVAERVRKMEEAGIISGYHTEVNVDKNNSPQMAFIRISTPAIKYSRVIAFLQDAPEVIECHHLTGADSFILKAHFTSVTQLEDLLGQLSQFGETTTSIVLSTPISRRALLRKIK